MSIVNLTDSPVNFDDGLDSVVITTNLQSLKGGRSLDVTGFTPTVIRKGHVIIRSTATGELKPMPVTGVTAINAFGVITSGSGYVNAGTYAAVALTGGSGTGATADITVYNGKVTSVTLVAKGTGYAAGDILSAAAANIGTGGTGFAAPVASVQAAAAYAALPASHTYIGILEASILTAKPFAGVMVRGGINPVAAPYDFATIKAAFNTATGNLITSFAD